MSEPKLLTRQLKLLPKNNIIMGDCHYFTKNVLQMINDLNIYGIFKISKNIKICKEFINSDKKNSVYSYYNNDIRFVESKINSTTTCILGTNLFDKINYPDNMIIELYKQRWFIEEYFKVIKCTFNLKNTKSKKLNNIMQEASMQMIIVAICKYIEIIAPKYVKNNLIKNIANDFLFMIFYKKHNNVQK